MGKSKHGRFLRGVRPALGSIGHPGAVRFPRNLVFHSEVFMQLAFLDFALWSSSAGTGLVIDSQVLNRGACDYKRLQ